MWAPFLTHSVPLTRQQTGQARARSHDSVFSMSGRVYLCVYICKYEYVLIQFIWMCSVFACLSVCVAEKACCIFVFFKYV